MKKIYFSFIPILAAATLWAQPIVTSANLHTGSSFNLYLMGDVNVANLVTPGANVIWDISDATTVLMGTVDFLDMSDTPFATDYPAANFAMKFTPLLGSISYSLFNLTDSVFEEVANNVGTSDAVSFIDHRTSLVFPFAFNSTNTDTYQKENQWIKTIASTYDAYGTFTANGTTSTNVVRFNTDDNGNNSVNWWQSDPLVPLMQGSSSGFVLWDPTSSTGIHDSQTNALLTMYPNPATNELHILNKAPLTKIEIFNSIGQLEISTTNSLIDISMLASGIYILKAQSEKASTSQEFIKF